MKENAIAVNEYDMIGAELYYCYNYIVNAKKIEDSKRVFELNTKKAKLCLELLKNLEIDEIPIGTKYEIKNSEYKDYLNYFEKINKYDWTSIPELKQIAEKKREELIANILEYIKSVDRSTGPLWFKIICCIIFPIISWIILLAGGFNASNDCEISSATIKKIFADIDEEYYHKCILNNHIFYNMGGLRKFYYSLLKKNDLMPFINVEKIKKELGTDEFLHILQKHNSYFYEEYEQKIKRLENEIDKDESNIKTFNFILDEIKKEFNSIMNNRTAIIPSVYHNEEDITNLIDYYVRRRGDIWKELVNEYEHDKKLNQIISSIDNLSNKVSVLTDSVIKCFNIVGMQLGIINQSILSLQNATAINLDKISQIENQQEKRLCELASSIQNMNVKTKVIIESK